MAGNRKRFPSGTVRLGNIAALACVPRYLGSTTATSWPRATRALGSASTTSARPPVFENGSPSEATNRILMISFAILVRFYRRPLSGQYLNGGDASSLAQIRTHRKRARSAAKHETGFSVRLAWKRKTDRSEGALRADRVETPPQSFDRGPALGSFPFRLQAVHRASRTDLALDVCGCRGERNARLDFHVQSRKHGAPKLHRPNAEPHFKTRRSGRIRRDALAKNLRLRIAWIRQNGALTRRCFRSPIIVNSAIATFAFPIIPAPQMRVHTTQQSPREAAV